VKKQKRVSIFTKLVAEKISSTVFQGFWKEQKRNSDVHQTERRKGNADDYHAIEKTESKRTEEMELA
jgi:isocitrate dehydrogenase kinase/phosphatase